MPASKGRRVAREAVTRVRERSAYAHETMDTLLASSGLDQRDTAFASRLAYGTISCRGTLDEAVARFATDPSRIEPAVLDCLATCAYEILFMRTPQRAAVNEGVELVKEIRPKAASFANAVLRRLAGDAASFPWGDASTDLAALARQYGHPLWLAERMVNELGRDAATAVMAANNEPAPLYLATLPFRASDEEIVLRLAEQGVDPQPGPLNGCVLAGIPAVAVSSDALSSGDVIVMDAGAQFAASCVPVRPGAAVCELGAGRGGKTLLLQARAVREGHEIDVLAVDVHAAKLESLTRSATLCGAPGIRTSVADAAEAGSAGLPLAGTIDSVLVDAPCSGLGTLRRHPDRRWRAREDESAALAALGGRMLATAASLVKPGGFVVYSTCTIIAEENDDVADAFLASAAGEGFIETGVADVAPAAWRAFVTDSGRFRSLPATEGPDGHFVTRFVREG